MSPRLKLRAAATPLVMAGALWATSALSPMALGGGAQTPPPCGPDGVCVPRPQTYGWYQTRWRTFPGDVAVKAPTPAGRDEGPEEEELGGVKLPDPSEEGQLGPARAPRGPAAPGEEAPAEGEEDAAAAGLGTLPGEVPLPGLELPGAQPVPEAEEEEAPANGPDIGPQPEPGAEPGRDPLDPFGSAPPAPPAWIRGATLQNPASAAGTSLEPLPLVLPAAAAVEPLPVSMPTEPAAFVAPAQSPALPIDGPNLHGDDAPPTLPPALSGSVGVTGPVQQPSAPPASVAAPKVVQPASVQPIVDDRVEAASAEEPVGIQLINPAAAMVDPDAEGLQQAIYFEASDQ